jgi:hypothetical protein
MVRKAVGEQWGGVVPLKIVLDNSGEGTSQPCVQYSTRHWVRWVSSIQYQDALLLVKTCVRSRGLAKGTLHH